MTDDDQKHEDRLHRQFEAIARQAPVSRPMLDGLRDNRYRRLRIPAAILLILGSFLAILPVFGLWMLPVGLMLLALDLPVLRPRVSAALIQGRRRISLWRRRLTRDKAPDPAASPGEQPHRPG